MSGWCGILQEDGDTVFSLSSGSHFHGSPVLLPVFSSQQLRGFGTRPALDVRLEEELVVGVGVCLLAWDLLFEEHGVEVVV